MLILTESPMYQLVNVNQGILRMGVSYVYTFLIILHLECFISCVTYTQYSSRCTSCYIDDICMMDSSILLD